MWFLRLRGGGGQTTASVCAAQLHVWMCVHCLCKTKRETEIEVECEYECVCACIKKTRERSLRQPAHLLSHL